jgi:ArsR family transcriptional regulator
MEMIMAAPGPFSVETIIAVLKAAGEATRLRILTLLVQGELTVKDLTPFSASRSRGFRAI